MVLVKWRRGTYAACVPPHVCTALRTSTPQPSSNRDCVIAIVSVDIFQEPLSRFIEQLLPSHNKGFWLMLHILVQLIWTNQTQNPSYYRTEGVGFITSILNSFYEEYSQCVLYLVLGINYSRN